MKGGGSDNMKLKDFDKNTILLLEHFPRLATLNIPFDILNKYYKICSKKWYPLDRDYFSLAIRTYIISKKNKRLFPLYSKGSDMVDKVILWGIDKYIDKEILNNDNNTIINQRNTCKKYDLRESGG